MKLYRKGEEALTPADSPIFVGKVGAFRMTQDISKDLNVSLISFENGARNTFHTHGTDQVLVITEGEGLVVSESEEIPVSAGDVVFIPVGERHWHGARPDRSMKHLSILPIPK